MVVHTRNMAVEAVKWTGMNHEELISSFGMEILDFGYDDDDDGPHFYGPGGTAI